MPIQEIDYDPFAEQYVREQELAKKRNILEIDYDPFAGTEEEHPAAAPSKREALQPPASKVGTLGGVASALGQGVAEGVTTAIPEMVGESLEFVGSYLPGQAVESIGKDLKEWAEAKGKSLYGEPKKREGLERWVYEGSKMLAPSVIPAGVVGTGVRILTGVGKLVKAGKAAELAGDVARAKEYYDAATKAAKLSNNVASASTAGLFGTAQAQSTRDNAELQAKKLEAAGDFEGARQAREAGKGWAPISSGAIEAGGEFFGTKYLGKLFRLDEAGVAKRGAKQLVSDFLKTLGVEVGTEMGQQGGEAYVEKVSGIRPEADPLAEALDVIGPTAFMIILTGGAAGAVNTMRRPDDAVDLLEDEKTKDQPDITETIRQAIGEQKKAEAQVKPRPSTAKEAAETFFGKEAVQNEQAIESLRRRGLYVPEDQAPVKSAEESARVFEEEQARRQGEAVRAAAPPARVAVPIGEPQLGVRPEARTMPEEAVPGGTSAGTSGTSAELPLFEPASEIEKIDQAGNEAATSPLNDRPQPTEAQKDAGNYAKGHVKLHGLDISIENPRGSERAGTDKAGKPWSVVMEHPYGYIRGTQGRDKDHLDVFIGPDPESPKAFVVDQVNPETGKWDEHKILLGFNTEEEARKGYLDNYQEGWKGLGAITEMPVDEFKAWAKSGPKTKPLAYKEAKDAGEVSGNAGSVLLGGERKLEEAQPGEVTLGGAKAGAVRQGPGEGGENLQRGKEAGRGTGERAGLTEPGEKKAPAPTPKKAEIVAPAPAGEAEAPKAKAFELTDRQRDIFVKELLKSEAPEVKDLVKQAEETWPGEDPGPVVESQIDYDLQKAPEKWLGTAAGKEILARKGWAAPAPTPEPEKAKEGPRKLTLYRGGKAGNWYTTTEEAAREYANLGEGGKVLKEDVTFKKVAEKADILKAADAVGAKPDQALYWLVSPETSEDAPKVIAELKKQGFDAAHLPEGEDFAPSGKGIESYLKLEEPAPKAEKREGISPSLKSLILMDMKTALEEGHKYGMRDDETVGQGSNQVPIGTTNPPWLMDIIRAMKAKNKQTTGKTEILAVIKKELEGKGDTFSPKQLKLWFIIEDHLREESGKPHYTKAAEIMSGTMETLIDDYNEGAAIGQYNDSDLAYPPTEKEIETAAVNVVSEEVANGNQEALQAYQTERGEARREENEAPAATAAPAEEVNQTEINKLEKSLAKWREGGLDKTLPDEYARYMNVLNALKAGEKPVRRDVTEETIRDAGALLQKAVKIGKEGKTLGQIESEKKEAKAEKVSRVNKDVRAWIRFKENEPDPGNSQTIHSIANHTIRPMLKKMEKAGWVEYRQLGKKGDTWTRSLDKAGLVDRAWDEEGNTYYGLKGTPLRKGLMSEEEAKAREEAEKMPEPKAETTQREAFDVLAGIMPGGRALKYSIESANRVADKYAELGIVEKTPDDRYMISKENTAIRQAAIDEVKRQINESKKATTTPVDWEKVKAAVAKKPEEPKKETAAEAKERFDREQREFALLKKEYTQKFKNEYPGLSDDDAASIGISVAADHTNLGENYTTVKEPEVALRVYLRQWLETVTKNPEGYMERVIADLKKGILLESQLAVIKAEQNQDVYGRQKPEKKKYSTPAETEEAIAKGEEVEIEDRGTFPELFEVTPTKTIEGKDTGKTTPKQQKAFLIDAIDTLIKDAPKGEPVDTKGSRYGKTGPAEQYERQNELRQKYGIVRIEVPDDGTFNIINTKEALEAFKKAAQKFPVSEGVKKAPPLPTLKPSGKRIAEEGVTYYNEFRPRKQELAFRPDDGTNNNYYSPEGYFTNGYYAVKTAKPKGVNPVSSPSLTSTLDGAKNLQPANLVGEFYLGGDPSSAVPMVHVIGEDGSEQIVNAKFIDSILTEHPNAKAFSKKEQNKKHKGMSPIFFKVKNDIVGVTMPLQIEDKTNPSIVFPDRVKEILGESNTQWLPPSLAEREAAQKGKKQETATLEEVAGEMEKFPAYTPMISDAAKRRINTLADKKGLKFSDLRDPQKGLMSQVQADPILALEYAEKMAAKDWEDTNFKNNFRKIADFIKKEWPVRSYMDIKGRWKSYAIDRTDEEGEKVVGMSPGGIYSSRTVYEYDGKGKPPAEDVAQLKAHGFKRSEDGRIWTSPVTHSETGRVLEGVEKETASLEEGEGEGEKPKLPKEPFTGYNKLVDIENNLGIFANRSIPDSVKRDATKLIEAIKAKDTDTISKIAKKYQGELGKGDVQGGPKEVKVGDIVKKTLAHTALREGNRILYEASEEKWAERVKTEHPPKQPWEMTKAEWQQAIDEAKINFTGTGGESKYGMGRATKEGSFNTGIERRKFLRYGIPDKHIEGLQIPAQHFDVVQKALSEGKPVPPAVLAEYPELGKKVVDKAEESGVKYDILKAHPEYESKPDELKIAEKAVNEVRELEGSGNVSAAPGEVARPREAGGITTHGIGISTSLVQKGRVDLRGRRARNFHEVAVLAEVFRNPQFETLRYVYVKDGKVVAHEGVTSRLPGAASIFVKNPNKEIYEINRRIERLGADGVWLVHNHPSGDPTPSGADVSLTQRMGAALRGKVKGHVVINHKKYVFIPMDGDSAVANQYGERGRDDLLTPSIEHRFLGQTIDSPSSAAAWARALYSQDDRSVILYRNAKGKIRAIQEVPVGLVKNKKALTEYIKGRKREFGSVGAIIVHKSDQIDYLSLQDLINSRVLEDSISIVENRYRSAREQSPFMPVEEEPKAFRVKETPQGVEMYEVLEARTDTPEFKKWFAGSKVVDEKGNPLVVYHHGSFNEEEDIPAGAMHFGTKDAAQERSIGKYKDDAAMAVEAYQNEEGEWHWDDGQGMTSEDLGEGDYGDEDSAIAHGRSYVLSNIDEFAIDAEGGGITAAYLSIQNPKRVADAGGANGEWAQIIEKAKAEGHDGIVYRNRYEDKGKDSYIVFSPTQIKSVFNRGTFSPENPDIRYNVRDLHRRGLLKVAKIDDVKKFFPGQEVGKDRNGNIYVKTRGGKYVTLYRVDHIEPNAVVILAGYGKTKFAPGSVIPGAFGQKSTGGYYIKLHRTFGDTWTLAHESMHFMETAGIINERDVEVLKAHIRNLHRDGRWDPANRKDIGGPEDRANFIADRLAIPEQRGPIGRIILRIRAFIDGILETFGVRSPESILRGIESGRVFERTGREGRTAEAYAPAIIPKSLAPMVDSIVQPGILSRAWDEFRYQAQDKFHFLNKAQIEAERRSRAQLPESQDAYLAETRYHGMAAAAIEDFDEKHVDPLIELMSESDISVEQADEYLHARHAREANEHLREINPDREDNEALSGMTDQEAEQILDRINRGPQAQIYKRIGRMVDAITKARRDLLIEAGLETEETIAKWEETYQHYVPLMREGKSEAMPRKGRGFEVRGGQKLRAGSTREVVNILANVVAQHEATIVRAEKAKVSRAFLEFAKAHRGPWKIDVPEKTASFDEDGLIVYRANPLGYMLADNVLAVRVDGKDHHITFDERDLDGMKILSALKNLDAADMGAVTRAVAKISRWLAVINTSLNPEFIISNFARDIQTAAYNMADNEADAIRMKAIKQVGSAFKGIREYQDNNRDTEWARWFNRFRNAGGQTGWIQSYETIQDREKALISKIEDMKHGKIRSVKRGLTAAFDYIADMNTAVENAIRLSVFKNLIEANVPESKAAKIAKELTVNFNRKGNMGPVLNAFYLFYNASIQGSARLIMAGAKSRKVRKLMGATIVFAAALDIMNRAVGGDDDDGENRYDKIAPWIKDRNMIIMLPGNGGHIQIPLPWGYNIFHVMGQAAGEVLTKKNNKATASALRVGGAIVSAFNPMGGESSLLQMISPTLLDPFVQWAENKDWSGRKLRPSANPYAEKPSSQTYWHSARVPSKWIAKTLNELTGGDEVRPGKIDISPESIDLAIDTVTGGAGKFVSNLISTPIKYAKGEDVETYEIPFLRRVYGKAGKQVLTQEYYENMDSVRLVQRQLSHYKNDPAKVREIAQEYKSEVRLIGRMKATQKAMKDLKDQLKAAENIKDPAVRKAREKKIDEVMQKIMTGFNKNYNLMKNRED